MSEVCTVFGVQYHLYRREITVGIIEEIDPCWPTDQDDMTEGVEIDGEASGRSSWTLGDARDLAT